MIMSDQMIAETTRIRGHEGDEIEAYFAGSAEPSSTGSVVVIHHMPGFDEGSKEITRRFAANGYLALCPNLHYRYAPGADTAEASAACRAAGGVPDARLVGDVEGAIGHLRSRSGSNGKIGVIGFCSGGRQAFLAACSLPFDAAVDCYGGYVVATPPPDRPVQTKPLLDIAPNLSCPLLGLFGAEDQQPSPADTAELEKALKAAGKTYDFHTYDGAGHAFFATERPSYRVEAAVSGWRTIFDFFGQTLTT
jgi:carboxymethylenebutenolidase